MTELIDRLLRARVYDLGQPYFVGMPHFPTHPPFLYGLTKKHGDFVAASGMSSAADSIALGGHTGTHMDALNHFSCGGKFFGGITAAEVQGYATGIAAHSIDTVKPILRRGLMLDIAGQQGVETLPKDFEISPEHLERAAREQKVEIRSGDVVLLRTGWARLFEDAARYVSETHCPGPGLAGAQWLSARQAFAAGSDTIAFEKVPNSEMPVHVHLLVESGIHIIEVLNMEDLARDRVYEFLFIATPMKIRGGTGGPMRPLAVVE
jgi:kynurenine formamidase